MEIELLAITPDAEELIENAARTCYQSMPGEKHVVGSLIKKLVKSGHHSVLEHAYATFRINGCSRAMTHQLVRHRLMAISQQSQRYVKESQFDYVIPPAIKEITTMFGDFEDQTAEEVFRHDMQTIQNMYVRWKAMGLKNEDARFVLPNACQSEIVISANMREFRHIFEVRCSKHAQWEIRGVAIEMLKQLYEKLPNVFEDIVEEYIVGVSG